METQKNEPVGQYVNLAAAKAALIKIRDPEESKKMDAEAIQNLDPQLRPYTDWKRRVIEHPLLRTNLYYPATPTEIDRINNPVCGNAGDLEKSNAKSGVYHLPASDRKTLSA